MLIRSQNKLTLTNDFNLYIESVTIGTKDTLRVYIKNKTVGTIGYYSSYEKATKVLDIICQEYEYNEKHKRGENYIAPKYIFQMPQDSEVVIC